MSDNNLDNEHESLPRVQGMPTEPDTKSWYEYIWKTQQETAARLEECAKFLSGVVAITLTLFLTIGKSSFENVRLTGAVRWAVGLWLLSLVLSIFVLFPWRYRYSPVSVESIKQTHKRIAGIKYLLLIGALIFFLAALALLIALFFDSGKI